MHLLQGQVVLQGRVVDATDSLPVLNVRITVASLETKQMAGYGFSGKDGSFSINIKQSNFPLIIDATALGYSQKSILLENVPFKEIVIAIEESAIQLKEVSVLAPKVSLKGDTINYMVSGFAKEGDANIEEVLKRLPGIEVTASGQIRYNDKPVNSLYIDGKDLLKERYSVATKNIRPDLVTMIQVFENHQPVKALKNFEPTENAAVNLRLDPQVKAKWIASGDAAAGVPFLQYEGSLMLFNFSQAMQTMNVIKANNRGKDASGELASHNLDTRRYSQIPVGPRDMLLNTTGLTVPPVGSERSLFNNGGYLSSASLFGLGKEGEVSLKAIYSYDEKEQTEQEHTSYHTFGEDVVTISESARFTGKVHKPSLDMGYKVNSESHFMQARFLFGGRFERDESLLAPNNIPATSAKADMIDANSMFTYIKAKERSMLRLFSNTGFSSDPQHLSVDQHVQRMDIAGISSRNGLEYTYRSGRLSFTGSAGYNLDYQELESSSNVPDLWEERLHLAVNEFFFSPNISYDSRRFKAGIALPVGIVNGSFRANPSFTLRYKFSPFWELWGGYSRNNAISDILSLHKQQFACTYRFFWSGVGKVYNTQNDNFSVRLTYNNPLKLMNVSFFGSIGMSTGGVMPSISLFEKGYGNYLFSYILREEVPMTGTRDSKRLQFSATKSFFSMPLLLDLKLSLTDAASSLMQQGEYFDTRYRVWSAVFSADASFGESTDISVKLPYRIDERFAITGVSPGYLLYSFDPSVNLKIKFLGNMRVAANITVNINEMSEGDYNVTPFADLRISYKNSRREYYIHALNMFDNREFRTKLTGELSYTERFYKLRPFSVIAGFTFTF